MPQAFWFSEINLPKGLILNSVPNTRCLITGTDKTGFGFVLFFSLYSYFTGVVLGTQVAVLKRPYRSPKIEPGSAVCKTSSAALPFIALAPINYFCTHHHPHPLGKTSFPSILSWFHRLWAMSLLKGFLQKSKTDGLDCESTSGTSAIWDQRPQFSFLLSLKTYPVWWRLICWTHLLNSHALRELT